MTVVDTTLTDTSEVLLEVLIELLEETRDLIGVAIDLGDAADEAVTAHWRTVS